MSTSKPKMSDALRQKIAELTNNKTEKRADGSLRKTKDNLAIKRSPPTRPPKSPLDSTNIATPFGGHNLPPRPSKKALRKLSNFKQAVSPATPISPVVEPKRQVVETRRSPRPSISIPEKSRKSKVAEADTIQKADLSEMEEQKERMKIIEQTRARLIGLRQQSSMAPQAQPQPPQKKLTKPKPPPVQTKKQELRTFFSQSDVTDAVKQDKPKSVTMDQLPEVDSEYVQLLKDRNKEEVELLKSQLELANLSIANMQNKLDVQESDSSKIRQLERKIDKLESELSEEDPKITELEELRVQDAEQIQQLEDALAKRQYEVKQTQETVQGLNNELEIVKQEYELVSHQLTTAKKDALLNQTKLHDLSDEVNQLREENVELSQQVSDSTDLSNEVKDMKLRLEQYQNLASSLESELDAVQSKEGSYKQQIVDLQESQSKLESDLAEQVERVEEVTAESQRNLSELLTIYEMVQGENEELHRKLNSQSLDNDWKQEREEIEEAVKYLENALVESRNLQQRTKAELDEVKSAPKFVSDDVELLDFIETMTLKVDNYRQEIDVLKVENRKLKMDTAKGKFMQSDSGYHSSRQASHVPASDRETVLEQELSSMQNKLDSVTEQLSSSDSENSQLRGKVQRLQNQVKDLKAQLQETQIDALGHADPTQSTLNLRREFRQVMQEVRQEYDGLMEEEQSRAIQLEKELRRIQRQQ